MGGRRWGRTEHARLEQHIAAGHSYASIARFLGRSLPAVLDKAKVRGVRRRATGEIYSAAQIASLLGVSHQTVHGWIQRGWLRARDGGTARLCMWCVTEESLQAFLEAPAYQMAWHPSTITDPDLRYVGQLARAGQLRWLTLEQVAAWFDVAHATTRAWVRKGLLPTTWYRKRHWVWERDLVGFVVPSERSARSDRRAAEGA